MSALRTTGIVLGGVAGAGLLIVAGVVAYRWIKGKLTSAATTASGDVAEPVRPVGSGPPPQRTTRPSGGAGGAAPPDSRVLTAPKPGTSGATLTPGGVTLATPWMTLDKKPKDA